MKKILPFFLLLLSATPALAANCSPYPYTLQNGQTADANQVMSNFNNILTCGNNNVLGVNNNLSDLQSPATARTNLGLANGSSTTITGSTLLPSGSGAAVGALWFQYQ